MARRGYRRWVESGESVPLVPTDIELPEEQERTVRDFFRLLSELNVSDAAHYLRHVTSAKLETLFEDVRAVIPRIDQRQS